PAYQLRGAEGHMALASSRALMMSFTNESERMLFDFRESKSAAKYYVTFPHICHASNSKWARRNNASPLMEAASLAEISLGFSCRTFAKRRSVALQRATPSNTPVHFSFK